MKKIKVFGLPSHQTVDRTSGVDFARIIQPLTYLNGYTDEDTKFDVTLFDIKNETDWLSVAKEFDIIYLNYIANSWGFAAMGAMARHYEKKIVLDLDDNLWGIRPDNPAFQAYQPGSEAIRHFSAICNEADLMTCTSSYLKNVIIHNTYKNAKDIKVIPNYIDLTRYKHRSPFKDTLTIQLMHHGSTTHFEDLSNYHFIEGVNRIMAEYPNVTLRFVGAFIPRLRMRWGHRFENAYGHEDINQWIDTKFPTFMDEADIIVVPLEDNSYTRCKSNIKWLETSSAKKVGCWAAIRQYEEVINHGKNGFICGSATNWYESIKYLIDNPQKRREMGEQAFVDVEKNWTIQKNIGKYAEVFKSIIDK